jgi:cobalt-zinc-cadmium resistance protein CzcA
LRSGAAFALSLIAVPFLGAEFMPRLEEGLIVIEMFRLPGTSTSESIHGNQVLETVVKEVPEVNTVVSRTGTPDVATDPMALDQSDVCVMLKPREEWSTKRSKDDLIAAIRERINQQAPGAGYGFSQPIQMRMQQLMETGSQSDVAVKIYGEDLEVLRDIANKVAPLHHQDHLRQSTRFLSSSLIFQREALPLAATC